MDTTSPRERVQRALRHEEPDHAPFSWGLGITPEMRATLIADAHSRGFDFESLSWLVEDIKSLEPRYAGPSLPARTDFWGVTRTTVSYGAGSYNEFTDFALADADTVSDIEAHPWPDPDWFDFSHVVPELKERDPDHRFAYRCFISASGNPLEQYTWLTGLEQTLVNLLVNKEVVHAALSRITDFFLIMMERMVDAAGDYIDLFYFADDLAGQTSLLFSRELYREMLYPYHERLIARSKELLPESSAMYHTDGAVFPIVPDLIDVGVDVLEAVQTDADGMEPERLKAAFGESLSFHGGIPVQSLLPHGSENEVRQGVRRLLTTLGAGGGYIAAPSHSIQAGTPPGNVYAMLLEVLGEQGLTEAIEAASR